MKWQADLHNGSYQNPILYVDYSDPDAIRVGEDYYMTASSFSNVPGLPVLHSRDLVNWELIGYALKKIPEFRYREPIHGCGVWAPAIRYHEGTFYICFPMPDEGIYMVTTKDPAGEWDEPVKIYDGAGLIDPCPFWDEDGKAYLVCGVAKSRIGYKSVLHMFEMRPDGKALLTGPVKIYDGTADGNVTTEGPKLYKREGYYYVFAPAGGVKTGWQIVLRSKNIYGPYEVRTVMKQGKTGVNGPHQGAWVTDTDGKDWFLHFQDVFAAGRITHLQPMIWLENGWPVIGAPSEEDAETGEPVLVWKKPGAVSSGQKLEKECKEAANTERKENKEGSTGDGKGSMAEVDPYELTDEAGMPALAWQWNANPQNEWVSPSRKAGKLWLDPLQVSPERPLCDYPNLLLRKWEAPEFLAEAELSLEGLAEGSFAGMMSMGTSYGGIGVLKEEEGFSLVKVKGQQVFDGGAVYARENKEKLSLGSGNGSAIEKNKIWFSVEVIAANQVTAVSPKPEYSEGLEGKVLHPESKIRICAWDSAGEKKAELEFEATAGRWVGVKYGFFHVKTKKSGSAGKSAHAEFERFRVV